MLGALALMAMACGGAEPSPTGAAASSTQPTTTAPAVAATTAPPSTVAPTPTIDVQGHRGARGLQPENTLPAFETALDLGVDTLELDLHFTADGEVIVWHDPIVPAEKCRNTTGSGPDPQQVAQDDLAIAGFSRADLGAFTCDLNPDSGRFPEQRATPTTVAGDMYQLVTLGELFDFVAVYEASDEKTAEQRAAAAAVMFNIETKRRPDQPETINDGFDGVTAGPFEVAILATIAEFGLEERVVIQSFDHRSLRAVRAADPAIRLAALTTRSQAFSADFASFAEIWSPDYRSLSASSLEAAHEAGLLVIPWTVNEQTDMRRLIELGVDGLISDRPDLLVEVVTSGA